MIRTLVLPFLFLLGANACDVFEIQTSLYVHFDDKSNETGWELSCDDGTRYWDVPLGSLSEAAGSWASYTACVEDTALCYFQISGDDVSSMESRPGSHFTVRYGDQGIQEGSLPNGLVTVCLGLGCDQASYPTKAPRAAAVPPPISTPVPTPLTPTFGPHMEQVPTKGPIVKDPVTGRPQEPTLGVTATPIAAPVAAPAAGTPSVLATPGPSSSLTMDQLIPSSVSFTRSPISSPVSSAPISTAPTMLVVELSDDGTKEVSSKHGGGVIDFTTTPKPTPATQTPPSAEVDTTFSPTLSSLLPGPSPKDSPTASPVLSDVSVTSTPTVTPVENEQAGTAAPSLAPQSGSTTPQAQPQGGTVSGATDAEDDGVDETRKFWRRRLTYIVLGALALCIQCIVFTRCLCLRSRRRKALQQRDRLDFEETALRDVEHQRTWSPRNPNHVYNR